MRGILITGALLLCVQIGYAQQASQIAASDTGAAANKQLVRTAANLKSGTSQDVLTSFFKLAYSDLSNGHHFQFNSSLFAVKAKTDTNLWIDTNYRRQKFARNLVFGIDYGVDSNYKFKSASLNIKYAIINGRDKDLFTTSFGKNLYDFMSQTSAIAAEAENIYFTKYPKERTTANFKLIGNFFFYNKKSDQTPAKSLPDEFKKILDSLLKANKMVTVEQFAQFRDSIANMYKVASTLLQQRSLWTVGSQVTANQQKLFNAINFNTEFLKGLTRNNTSMGAELDIKANFNSYDTTAANVAYHRNVLLASAGINWIIYKDKKTQKSYVEFKPGLTYDNVIGGLLPSESKSKFTGDGVLRFRITDSLWIPFDIKYDPKSGKFFGFLNITSNFDWLGASKSLVSTN